MNRTLQLLGLGLAATLLISATGGGNLPTFSAKKLQQDPAAMTESLASETSFTFTDRTFVSRMTQGHNYEIAAAELALTLAKATEVKTFAQLMLSDHKNLRGQLAAAVGKVNPAYELPADIDVSARQQVMLERLENAGDGFDAEYKAQMMQSHEEALNLLESYLGSKYANPIIRTEAQKAWPVVEAHHQAVDAIPAATP
ncbi:DUF4142 domain-containing protein [Deinococcus roseus]|uniref:DUF4142 domain-containing protein n=1 Tax=Deinococcus roseus TaxID=392414 RepID=A0ABQ2CX00_9DEIO|nr:DUF4142 domain-containing protein [Deinococcus roseus]GGJ29115.1 hypothetical protein GCM10008938_14040 [Deinococcus roseus]